MSAMFVRFTETIMSITRQSVVRRRNNCVQSSTILVIMFVPDTGTVFTADRHNLYIRYNTSIRLQDIPVVTARYQAIVIDKTSDIRGWVEILTLHFIMIIVLFV
jgi:hypothetical protein